MPSIEIDVVVNREYNAKALVDSGCASYGLISERFTRKHQLEREPIMPRGMSGFDGVRDSMVQEIAKMTFDDGSGRIQTAMFYIVPRIEGHDIMLGLPYLMYNKAHINPNGPRIDFEHGATVYPADQKKDTYSIKPISANAFTLWREKQKQDDKIKIFAVSLKDIEKALKVKQHIDPREKLPSHYHKYLDVFDRKKAEELPPYRPGVDHKIDLIEKDETGKKPEVPWGPLYNMSREELLALRKTLLDYLDKGFIRVSTSPAAAPVLFAKKPGGGLRFCVDYRALNKITRKDRYPLPLIHETLERISKAKWFTKLDVTTAFHRIRIAEGDEWMTAFRTRFGLFEWLVTPFGLANAPSTFQRYINWTLREFLDDFVSAYLDDILIFTEGSLAEHRKQVEKVLQRLRSSGLQLDIGKCEFEVQRTKYLGYILEAGKGISMDPEKVKAIIEWEAPRSVKGVRSFLGFANFYRRFIREFSKIVSPLTALTQKDVKFEWTEAANDAFLLLKKMFTTAPILVQFDPERETVIEADSSGYAIGGTLSQYDNEGLLRPCAYFSRKNSPAECNYEIHDKELLAIIACLKEWESEISGVKKFRIITDHKNLRYFTSIRRLTERQMRWSDVLARYDFLLEYRPGKLAQRPDALSRREQDMPEGDDERLKFREKRLFDPAIFEDKISIYAVRIAATNTPDEMDQPNNGNNDEETDRPNDEELANDPDIRTLWTEGLDKDESYERIRAVVKENLPQLP